MSDQKTSAEQIAKLNDIVLCRGEYAYLSEKFGNVTRARFQKRLDDPEGLFYFLGTGEVREKVVPRKPVTQSRTWITALIEREREYWVGSDLHKSGEFDFSNLDLSRMVSALEKKGEKWHEERAVSLLRKVCYIPRMVFREGMKIADWIWPEKWFFEQKKAGNIWVMNRRGILVRNESLTIPEQVVIMDTRPKPIYDNGRQTWDQDEGFCGHIIKSLREEGKIQGYSQGPVSSRFNIYFNEWQKHIRLLLAKEDGLKPHQMKLESVFFMNIFPQIYTDLPRAKDGATNTSVWLEEYFGVASRRLHGGDSVYGGLADVSYSCSGYHWRSRSFRPLGVIS